MQVPQQSVQLLAHDNDVHVLEADDETAIEAFRRRVYGREDTWVQELLSNARDALRERRSTEPGHQGAVRITVNHDTDLVSVEDDGPGLNRRLLEDTFRVLGRSTRRASDAYTGAWGIGSKSPLKVVDSFTLTTRSQADQARYELVVGCFMVGGAPRWGFRISHEAPCTGPWGTRVDVHAPKRLLHDVVKRAEATTATWSDEVLLTEVRDGASSTRRLSGHQHVDKVALRVEEDEFEAWLEKGWNRDRIYVDDIPYRVEESWPRLYLQDLQIVARLKRPSLVDLTTGRESLDLSECTRQTLKTIQASLLRAATKELETCLEAPASFADAAPGSTGRWHRLHERLQDDDVRHDLRHALLQQVRMHVATKQDALGNSRPEPGHTGPLYEAFRGAPAVYNNAYRRDQFARQANGHAERDGPMLVHVQAKPDSALATALEKYGATYLKPATTPGFRVRVSTGCGVDLCTDVEELRGTVLIEVPRLDAAGERPRLGGRVRYLVRPSKSALRQLRAAGMRVLSVDGLRKRLAKRRVETNRGPMAMRDLKDCQFVLLCPKTWLRAHEDQHVVVRAGFDELRCLSLLHGRPREAYVGQHTDLERLDPLAPILHEHFAKAAGWGLWDLWKHDLIKTDEQLRAANRHLDRRAAMHARNGPDTGLEPA